MNARMLVLCCAWTSTALAQHAPQDVTVTNAIPPAGASACALGKLTPEAAKAFSTPEDVKRRTGCEVKKLSSFQILGSTTEIYEAQDGTQRLQITVRDNRVVSHTLRKL